MNELLPLRYVLVNDDRPNAFMISAAIPAIMGVSTGLVAILEYEDEFAGIGRHELHHKNLSAYVNTMVQEWLADQSAPDALQSAGYNPDGLVSGLRKLPKSQKKTVHSYMDVHPSTDIRIRDQEIKTVVKARKEGDLNTAWTIFDAAVQRAVLGAATPPRYVERSLQAAGYGRLSPADKIYKLRDIIQQEFASIDEYYESRVEDFGKVIASLAIDQSDPAQNEAFNELVDRILIPPPEVKGSLSEYPWTDRAYAFYRAAERSAGGGKVEKELRPIGRMQELERAVQAFTQATSAEEAEHHAAAINRIASLYDFGYAKLASAIKFSNFLDPEIHDNAIRKIEQKIAAGEQTEGLALSWTPHVAWANQASSSQIREALIRLKLGGDPRLSPLDVAVSKTIQVLNTHAPGGPVLGSLKFDDRGQAIGIGEDFEKRLNPHQDGLYRKELLESEIRRVALRDQVERRLVESIDWQELERDFDAFTAKYKKYLIPEITVAPNGGDTFARAFMQHLSAFIEKDPDSHKPVVHRFFKEQLHNDIVSHREQGVPGFNLSGDFAYGMPMGMSPAHPYVDFALNDPHGILNAKDKARIIQHAAYLKTRDMTGSDVERFSIIPERVYGSYDQGFDGLLKFFNDQSLYYDTYTLRALDTRLYAFLVENNGAPLTPLQMHAIRSIAAHLSDSMNIRDEPTQLVQELAAAQAQNDLRPGLTAHDIPETYALYIAGKQFSQEPQLRRRYEKAIMERAQVLKDVEEQERLAQALLHAREMPTLLQIRDSIRGCVKHDYTGQLQSHDFRDWSTSFYVRCLASQLGIDKGKRKPDYFQQLKDRVGELHKSTQTNASVLIGNVSNTVLSEIVPALADAINAQPKAAYYLRDIYNQRNLSTAIALGFLGGGVELSIDVLTQDPLMCQQTIDFLTTPLTRQAALDYGRVLNREVTSGAHANMSGLGKLAYEDRWSDTTRIEIASAIHQNFQRAGIEGRGWYLDKILFPTSEKSLEAFQNAMCLVMEKTFPGQMHSPEYQAFVDKIRANKRRLRAQEARHQKSEEMWNLRESIRHMGFDRGSPEEAYANKLRKDLQNRHKKIDFKDNALDCLDRISYGIGKRWNRFFGKGEEEGRILRQIAESYIEVVPLPEQRVLLTAIMAARDVSQHEEEQSRKPVRAGVFAVRVLTYMDEMGGKVLQAIHSHRAVSKAIKNDTKHAKSNYNPPKRWEVIEWCQKYGIKASSPLEEIVEYGAVVGAGSMGVTMFNLTADGNLWADTLLRPYAPGRSAREAGNMMRASRRLAEKNPKMVAAVDIAKIAKRDARMETCMPLSHKQGEVAKQVYGGLETWAIVDGKRYHLKHETADVTRHSEGAKRAKVIAGKSFNKLPEATQEQRDFKKAAAIQLYGVAMLHRCMGLPCNLDPHGDNQNIEGETVGHYDFGMMELALPTETQKRALTKAIIHAYRDHMFLHKDTSVALDAHIQKADVAEVDRDYLSGFKRQNLALGDVEDYLTETDKKAIIGAILASGKLDSVIRDELQKDLGPLKSRLAVHYLTKVAEKHPIFRFAGGRDASELVMPVLTDQEQAIISGEEQHVISQLKTATLVQDRNDPEGSEPKRQMSRR